MTELTIGSIAPNFTLPSNQSGEISLGEFKGIKNVVLYFYPKDDTPGCTQEACDFRDNMARLQSKDTVVLGVSRDILKSHNKFSEAYKLPFPLLSDVEGVVCQKYDCWKEKSMYGKKYFGIERSTFLIDKNGVIQSIWRKVKVEGHVGEVLKKIEEL